MGTLLVLLRKFVLAVMFILVSLIILSTLGVNIGPLIAGAGVFGLAIGFGAQTLVKDIISGVFFLMDDAFRVGDFIETGGTKGMVEHISLRSLRLRNPRGMVYFIPFGDMKTVTNLSRDYVIMKLDFRVRYDADVEKIRKLIKKKVYKKIMEDPELGPKLLEPIKSQGVREMDDSAMIMRVKYKTKPGDQFAIRKEVYHLMQEAFKEEGIEFAHRNVTVYMPPEPGSEASAQAAGDDRQKDAKANSEIQRQAAAAAALAAIQAQEEAEKVTTIYVGNLPIDAKAETLQSIFSRYGYVTGIEVVRDRKRSRHARSYGLIEMPRGAEATDAVAHLNGQYFRGMFLRVRPAGMAHDA